MKTNWIRNFYYILKVILPRRIQIYIRRILLRRKIHLHKDIWPIDKSSAKLPENWQGWPDGKMFALVLTHDVESVKGLDKCRELMKIEEELGFRSSFNFVPGDYDVPLEFIDELKKRGFEAGLHGLHHNGNIFRSKNIFSKHAQRIKKFCHKWDAVGFRAPSMYHNLKWLHDLDVEYDASTFDTDPFEPQPDSSGTIFPFWVESNNEKKGYVELPYTLPQDFLLYILLQHKNIDIWKTKLDWIVKHGGMALFITHPDYMKFNKGKLNNDEYPAEYYEEFLKYIKTKYRDQYWHVLPKDMARFWSANYRTKRNITKKPKHICMLAYSFYESDNRIMRYADALAQRGDTVDVIALRDKNSLKYEKLKNVNVYRIQKRIINEKGKISYLSKLMIFLLRSSIFLTRKHLQYPYDVIHVHSVPDFEVFAALLPKMQGTGIILDIHDIVPEFYASKFSNGKDSFFFKALIKTEQISIKFSDHVIISNHLWYKTLINRSVDESKCTTIMNYPDESVFYMRSRIRKDKKFIMLYPGTLGWHQGMDIAVKAFAKIKDRAPEAEFHIYGSGTETNNLKKMIRELNLTDRVFIKDPMPLEQIAEVMANADLGVIPKRNDSFGGEAFSTKTLEFMSLGIPIVISGTKIDKYYFNDSVVKFFKPDDVDDLSECMLTMVQNQALRNTLRENALRFVEDYHWSKKKHEYFELVDSLIMNIRKHKE
ncbi:MAG TPA: glycosyltransferase [Smithella sp.]|nr:glycosyltransferase [Smithella sp.]